MRKATGKDISTLWTPVTLDQATLSITQGEAATVSNSLLGALLQPGADRRPGDSEDWKRYLTGIRDLQDVPARWTQRRDIRLRIRSHLSAAIAFGRVFNQAAGWRTTVHGRHGDVGRADHDGHPELRLALDKGAASGDVSIEIDLLGVNVSDLASDTLSQLSEPATNRLCI